MTHPRGRLPRKDALTAGAILVGCSALARWLPQERDVVHWVGPLLFLLRTLLAALPIAASCVSLGHLLMRGVQRLWEPQSPTPRPEGLWGSLWLLLLKGLAGALSWGWLLFLGGRLLGLSEPVARALFLIVVFLAPLNLRGVFEDFRGGRGIPSLKALLGRGLLARISAVLLLLFIPLRGLTYLNMASHGDGYLYHLAVAETWLNTGQVGLFLTNIYSGYALCVEHFYLLLRIALPGQAEQTALAQLFHPLFGYATAVAALVYAVRRHVGAAAAILALALSHYAFSSSAFQPKNDAFLAGITLSAMVALQSRRWAIFLTTALFGLTVKPTGAVAFLAMGCVHLFAEFRAQGFKGAYSACLRLTCAALLMVAAWSPFAINNTLLTGNPFFPLFNGLFGSPFGPAALEGVVREMRPFQTHLAPYLWSLWELGRFQPLFFFSVFLIAIAILFRRHPFFRRLTTPEIQSLTASALLTFFLIQIFAGPYLHTFTSRHYLSAMLPLLTATLAAVWHALAETRFQRWFTLLALAFALSGSMFEVLIKDLWKHVGRLNQTAEFLAKRPQMAFNVAIDRWLTQIPAGERRPTILSLAFENKPFFLEHADLCHINFCWPAWSWNLWTASPEQLRQHLSASGIRYVIVGHDTFTPLAQLARALPHALILEGNGYSLLDLKPAWLSR